MGSHSKSKPHLHACTKMLQRIVNELFNSGKGHDFIEFKLDLGFSHPQDCSAQVDVFTPCKFWVKARTYLQQAPDAASNFSITACRFGNAGENLKKGRLSCAVPANQSQDFSASDFQAYVL